MVMCCVDRRLLLPFLFLFHDVVSQHRSYNFLMPGLPAGNRHSISSTRIPAGSRLSNTITRQNHPFTTRSFSKIIISGGPFNVKLFQNINQNDNFTSVDVETEQSIHDSILIDIQHDNTLFIRTINGIKLTNKTNITLLITYRDLNELNIDGTINVECVNQIQTDSFLLHNRGTGSLKLKLNVNILDAFLHSIGRVKLCGQVNEEATIKSLGVGDVECRHLLTKKINIISSGIGNIHIMAIEEINVTLSGIGTVYYTGPIKQQIKTGLGNIVEVQGSPPPLTAEISTQQHADDQEEELD